MKSAMILSSILKMTNQTILSESFREKHKIGAAFSRSGKLSFSNLMYFVLHSTHKSISINYARLIDSLPAGNLPFVSKQAISKVRQGISYKDFEELFRLLVDQFYNNSTRLSTWKDSPYMQ